MAAKRKRSLRGLGGSSRHHGIQAGLSFKEAAARYKLMKNAAEKKSCGVAFSHLLVARKMDGEGMAHLRETDVSEFAESYSGEHDKDATRVRSSAWQLFEQNCLANQRMSGLGRRPSRRRK
jgi:hypothetical protein